MALPLEERNVTVYAWCVSWDPSHPRAGSETVDEELYRLAEEKAVRIGKVSRILKEHAVDCHMLLPKNDRSGEEYGETLMMTDAQGNKREHNFRDTPGSRECDFKTECAIRCAVPVGPGEAGSDKSTLLLAAVSGSDSEIRREIRNRMNTTPVTSFRELLLFIRSQIPGVREDRVKGVLHRMMIEETRLLLPRGGMGVLEYRIRGSEEVISIRPVEISDTRAPYLTRTARVPRRPVGFWNVPMEGEEQEKVEGEEQEKVEGEEQEKVEGEEQEEVEGEEQEKVEGEEQEEETGTGEEETKKGEEGAEKGMGGEAEARAETRRVPKAVVIEPPFIEFLGEFANAWKEMNREDVEFSFIKTKEAQKENYKSENLGKILSVFRQQIKSVPENVWTSTLAENLIYDNERLSTRYPFMADPVLRKEYLVQIAKGSDDDTPLGGPEFGSGLTIKEAIRLLNTAFTTTGEIIPATRRNPTAKIITMNTEGLIDTIGTNGEVISTGDVGKALIGQGLHG